MQSIEFDGGIFPLREVTINEWTDYEEKVLVSTIDLERCLFKWKMHGTEFVPDYGEYLNADAKKIDETISFYVTENQIGLSDFELAALLESNY